MYKFDVFICCKSEDYGLAREVYTFLVQRGYSVFLADTELRKKGNAVYGKVIDYALESAKHFILVSSNKEYVQSSYVESEWRTFIEEIRAGRKKGNLLTVLKGIDVVFLPISLRKYQSFQYQDFCSIIDYLPLENPRENKITIEKNRISEGKEGFKIKYLYYGFIFVIIVIIFLLVISSKLPSNTDVQPIEGASETLNIDISSVNLIGEHSFKSREPSEELKITIINWYRKSALSPDNFVKYLESNNPKILDDISKENIYNLIIMQ